MLSVKCYHVMWSVVCERLKCGRGVLVWGTTMNMMYGCEYEKEVCKYEVGAGVSTWAVLKYEGKRVSVWGSILSKYEVYDYDVRLWVWGTSIGVMCKYDVGASIRIMFEYNQIQIWCTTVSMRSECQYQVVCKYKYVGASNSMRLEYKQVWGAGVSRQIERNLQREFTRYARDGDYRYDGMWGATLTIRRGRLSMRWVCRVPSVWLTLYVPQSAKT